MLFKTLIFTIAAAITLSATGCKSTRQASADDASSTSTDIQVVNAPSFDADSAYAFTQAQCDFGPRVPGTDAHARCAKWLSGTMAALTDTMIVQEGQVTTFDGKTLNIKNIIGSINPDADSRILLLAHWDCRPWADNDPAPANHSKPVMGANDAASGVAVILEIARAMKAQRPTVGVDLLLVDAEDWGADDDEDSWALGTQYWAQHLHVSGYAPRFGILLDMVGARGAQFSKEIISLQNAPSVVDEVWDAAREAGYGNYFSSATGGAITDDHVQVNAAGIKCIDIIDMRQDSGTGFFSGWHTTSDTMDNIDPAVLKAVGQTLLNVIYSY